jgi:hypothetical protein
MQTHFERCLDRVRRRIDAAILLDRLNLVLAVAGALVLAAILVQRLLAAPVLTWQAMAGCGALAAAAVAVLWYVARPTRMQVALLLDERMALKERFSTTLALSDSADPFVLAARREAHARAEGLDVSKSFPIRVGRRWLVTSLCWAAAGAAVAFMPTLDLLGRQAAANLLAQQRDRAREASAEVNRVAARVEAMVKRLDMPEVAAEVAQLADIKPEGASEDIRREAIRKMGEIADRLQERGAGDRPEAARMLEQMMKQLRIPAQASTQKVAQALARGKYGEAAQALQKMREELARDTLKPEERAAIARDMESLAKQLAALARQQKELEDALAAAGCDRGLAQLSPEALRKALEKAGVDSDTIEKLLRKQQASQLASSACKNLADAMAKCSGGGAGGMLSPDALEGVEAQLSELEALRQQLALLRAAVDELQAGAVWLGMGLGGAGPFSPDGNLPGPGTGNRGQGEGPRPFSADTPTNTLGTRAPGQTRPGPVIATWYSQEQQVAGEAKREFQDALQAAKDRASEAVSENVIPSRYHESVKRYFDMVGKPDEAIPQPPK